MSSSPAVVTLRVPPKLLDEGRSLARKRGLSLNALVREALERMVEADRRAVLANAYDELGRVSGASEVESFLVAQAEAISRG